MSLRDYDYHLPESAVAQTPLADRAASKLLWLDRYTGEIRHRHFRDVPEILLPGDLLVLNNTRVTAVRLFGNRPTGGKVELLLLRRVGDGPVFEALAKPGARLTAGARILFDGGLEACVREDLVDRKIVSFAAPGDVDLALQSAGRVPLPPYIHERVEDDERYQTVYSSAPGSAAAPTAGLHFTPEILRQLGAKGVRTAYVTLDVGLDTFRPVTSENLEEHKMHGERCRVPPETAEAVASCQGRIIAVGTTATRTLESFAEGAHKVRSGEMVSHLFIRPPYDFKVIDGMFTNFHMPRTTMLLMLAAMVGREALFRAYDDALKHEYRFLSFGDSMLIL